MTFAAERFSCDIESPRRARLWSIARLSSHVRTTADFLDLAALVVSELVTNAVRAGCGVTRLELSADDEQVRITVVDDAPGEARMVTTADTDEHGRGLQIVSRISSDWGSRPDSEGKQVWACLPLPLAATA